MRKPMSEDEEKIYQTVYGNAILFLKRAIKEILSQENPNETFDVEIGIVSSLFVQMTIELALKAFLIKNTGIRTILKQQYKDKSDDDILASFEKNELHTKKYNDLKKALIDNENLVWFDQIHIAHLDQFQQFRNKLIHLNLFLEYDDLVDLKGETIFVIIHILIPLLTEISFEFETPTEFYEKYLTKKDFQKLISFPPYVEEMERIANEYSDIVYECPRCSKKTYSPENNLCYCCNLNYTHGVEYTECNVCHNQGSVIFDPLNIEFNGHIMHGLCLACGNKPEVFKCPVCKTKVSFFLKDELTECTPERCIYEK